MAGDPEAPAPETRARARAQARFAEAMQAIGQKDNAQAATLLREALAADPSMGAAHQSLAEIHERTGDEAAALEAYRAWAASDAHTPHPYNRMGEILEQRRNFAGAVKAYTRSIEIEWNQPPVIEARRRAADRAQEAAK